MDNAEDCFEDASLEKGEECSLSGEYIPLR